MSQPTDNLVRLDATPAEYRDDTEAEAGLMVGHFAVFDQWSEINSQYEGNFMERIAPGAFTETLETRGSQLRVLYDHGKDPQIGNKPLGTIRSITEDELGAAYSVELFDTTYVNDLKPALRAGQLGSSFRFSVGGQQVTKTPKASDFNPKALPERTVTKAKVYEFGPVTFPAYAGATAGLRSRTDEFIADLLTDPTYLLRFAERVGNKVAEQVLASLTADGHSKAFASSESTDGDGVQAYRVGMSPALVRARALFALSA